MKVKKKYMCINLIYIQDKENKKKHQRIVFQKKALKHLISFYLFKKKLLTHVTVTCVQT